ncbi:hypothetical protein JRQ81_019293 [Phrynocephalus forsythii]|uniref:Uncharacterized protein n=1 Tax=Phrynocephalus forsythii TaxID=171643 RepID=A0A9Q0XMQ0_9SAUR|nr:hypothetical protein JRQ81_019293 [Phrynocephalus forsythii]
MYYINKQGGTHSQRLLQLTIRFWDWCISNNIHPIAMHLPGEENSDADDLSRRVQATHEWEWHPKTFSLLCSKVVIKTLQERAYLILIAPWWPRQPWFASLLQMSSEHLRLVQFPELLSLDNSQVLHPDLNRLQLTAWRILSSIYH